MKIKKVKHLPVILFLIVSLFAGKNSGVFANEHNVWNFSTDEIHISEIMASNASVLKDEDGDYSDWIEISNPTAETIDLNNWFLTDNLANPVKWKFPDVQLMPGAYLVVFASGKDKTDPAGTLHTNFKLNAAGENLALIRPDITIAFSFNGGYPAQYTDVSYGIIGGEFQFLKTPTPGSMNIAGEYVPPPDFSAGGGIYDDPVSVVLSTTIAGGNIRFTTDGSEPTLTNGITYSSPVQITSTTPLRAVVYEGSSPSDIVTHTYFLLDDVIRRPDRIEGYPEFWGPYKTLTGNAIADYGMDPEVYDNPLYADSIKKAFLSIPILSLVTDKNNLFLDSISDEFGGIYIYTGMDGVEIGRGWERPVSAEYIINGKDEDGFQVNCGLRIQGGEGRVPEKSPKHSFRLIFRGDYGPTKLKYKLFNDSTAGDKFNTLILRAGFCNSWYHWDATQRKMTQYLRDPWTKDAQLDIMAKGARNCFVHLFLNGIYWGLYDLSERLDEKFMETYLGGNEEDFDILKDYTELVSGLSDAWNAMMSMANNGLTDNTDYFKIQGKNADGTENTGYANYLDVENLIDYMIINIYGGNNDWDHHNWVSARNRVNPGKGFQFFCWDAEHVLESTNASVVNENNDNCPSRLYAKLRENDDFRMLFADHVYRHLFNEGALTPYFAAERYKKRGDEIKLAMICESARWGDYRRDVHSWRNSPYDLYTPNDQWLTEYNRIMDQYFPARTQVVIDQFISQGLYPGLDPPVFSKNGGPVESGYALTISATAGTIYYTTNGKDPRSIGGTINPDAIAFSIPVSIQDTLKVMARTKDGTTWSALAQAVFYSSSQVKVEDIFTGVPGLTCGSYPNPFTATTFIYYDLPRAGRVDVSIYAADGRFIGSIFSGFQHEGRQSVTWDPGTLESGMYFYVIHLDNQTATGKLVFIK
jgi:hypothetical protein